MNLIIIQARMGSSRLPGKVLRPIKGMSLLEIQQLRINGSRYAHKSVIATTTNEEDDAIASFCVEKGIAYSRGSDWDVLDRYYQTAKSEHADHIIRITSDCPLHHHSVIDFVFSNYLETGCDYFSNSNKEPDFLEDGFDVEVFSFSALESAWKEARLLSEREHVTPYIKNSGKFTCAWKKFSEKYHYKLSVDTEADFRTVESIFNAFPSVVDFGMEEVVALLERHPEITDLNKDSVINSGYKKSLDNDRTVK
jgi:spore coat polysaccharide biosynthesis protein SpsF (cytidylyltransferase family)